MTNPTRCLALAALFAVGCGADEPIRTYETLKPAEYASPPPPSPDYRLLGAMFPAEEPEWFFKTTGKAAQLAKYEAEFDKLLTSVRFVPDKDKVPQLPTFTAPADWVRTGPRTVRSGGIALQIDETLRFGPPDDPLEITVTQAKGGNTERNVSRWADQVGYRYTKYSDLKKVCQEVKGDGVVGLRVDAAGMKNPAAPRGPMSGMGR